MDTVAMVMVNTRINYWCSIV